MSDISVIFSYSVFQDLVLRYVQGLWDISGYVARVETLTQVLEVKSFETRNWGENSSTFIGIISLFVISILIQCFSSDFICVEFNSDSSFYGKRCAKSKANTGLTILWYIILGGIFWISHYCYSSLNHSYVIRATRNGLG